jgi:hypothetical protein
MKSVSNSSDAAKQRKPNESQAKGRAKDASMTSQALFVNVFEARAKISAKWKFNYHETFGFRANETESNFSALVFFISFLSLFVNIIYFNFCLQILFHFSFPSAAHSVALLENRSRRTEKSAHGQFLFFIMCNSFNFC